MHKCRFVYYIYQYNSAEPHRNQLVIWFIAWELTSIYFIIHSNGYITIKHIIGDTRGGTVINKHIKVASKQKLQQIDEK